METHSLDASFNYGIYLVNVKGNLFISQALSRQQLCTMILAQFGLFLTPHVSLFIYIHCIGQEEYHKNASIGKSLYLFQQCCSL